jgi:hypothetical protein
MRTLLRLCIPQVKVAAAVGLFIACAGRRLPKLGF